MYDEIVSCVVFDWDVCVCVGACIMLIEYCLYNVLGMAVSSNQDNDFTKHLGMEKDEKWMNYCKIKYNSLFYNQINSEDQPIKFPLFEFC